jgi:hypothetical protein
LYYGFGRGVTNTGPDVKTLMVFQCLKGILLRSLQTTKLEKKKKKEERKNTDNICISGTNIRLNQNHHLYWYQVTKALGLLVIIRKGRCNFLLPVH